MNQIKAKIYYLISTGEILTITSEMEGCVEETTKEQDMKIHSQLKDKSIDEVDFIELEYGTMASTFNNIKSYSVDVENKKLNFVYFLDAELAEQKKQYDLPNRFNEELTSKISSISEYLNQDTSSIADIEDYILQKELNNLNGGM